VLWREAARKILSVAGHGSWRIAQARAIRLVRIEFRRVAPVRDRAEPKQNYWAIYIEVISNYPRGPIRSLGRAYSGRLSIQRVIVLDEDHDQWYDNENCLPLFLNRKVGAKTVAEEEDESFCSKPP